MVIIPNYCYLCDDCGNKFEEFRTVGDHVRRCPKCNSTRVGRDYQTEFSGIGIVADGWESGGYNFGISYRYKNKADLLREIRSRGFEPSLHDNGLKPIKRELYGDEKRMLKHQNKTEPPQVIIED